MNAHDLKALQSRAAKLDAEIKIQNSVADREVNKLRKMTIERSSLQQRIKECTPKDLKVTEHALLRLCERKFGLPLAEMEAELKKILQPFSTMGAGTFPIGDGLKAVIKDKTVITVKL